MGDRERARQEVETALSIDPDFLAARLMRDQLSGPETSTVPPAPEVFQAPPPPKPAPRPKPAPSLAASTAKLSEFEAKVRQRVQARDAVVRSVRQPAAAPVRRPRARAWRVGSVAAAGVAFAVAMSSNTRVPDGPRLLYSRAMVVAAPLVDTALPLPVDLSDSIEDVLEQAPEPVRTAPAPQPAALRPVPLRVSVTTPLSAPAAPAPVVATPLPVQAATVSSVVTDSPPPAILPRPVDDRALVEETLSRYRRAYNRLDARSAQAVYPAVNAPALARAFDGLQSQSLQFDECDIDVRGALANVTCRGTSRYVPKIGNRDPRVEPRVWDFTLRKDEGDWKIENARAGR